MFPWTVLIFPIVVTIGMRAALVFFDRRRRWRRGKPVTPPFTGNCARYRVLDIEVPHERIDAVAVAALRRCRATPETDPLPPPSWWLGYSGMSWITWGSEFAIAAAALTPSVTRFWCCSRPRFTTVLFDFGVSGRAANRLASALYEETMRLRLGPTA